LISSAGKSLDSWLPLPCRDDAVVWPVDPSDAPGSYLSRRKWFPFIPPLTIHSLRSIRYQFRSPMAAFLKCNGRNFNRSSEASYGMAASLELQTRQTESISTISEDDRVCRMLMRRSWASRQSDFVRTLLAHD
jgi:hypothetical protein